MRVAILGGGMGGLSAAWKLSELGHQVTVYQRGWRLGGKGASGRNLQDSQRIEEHGLHILMGFYDNTFHLLYNVYKEANGLAAYPDGRPLQWDDAFTPTDEAAFSRQLADGSWSFFRIPFPTNPLRPWDAPRIPDFVDLVRAAAHHLAAFFDELRNAGLHVPIVGPLLQEIVGLATGFALKLGQHVHNHIAKLIEEVLEHTWPLVEGLVDKSEKLEWIWTGICLAGGNLIGILRDGLVTAKPDFDKLNGQDYAREWLKGHLQFLADEGCPETDLWWSPMVTGLYDLAFSRSTTLAAGVTLRVILRLGLDYRGHIAYRMNSGMGDIVFAPLHLALAKRGVQFRYFHRVTQLHLDAGKTRIESIDLERQVDTPAGYDPLVEIGGQACWPNEPKTALLSAQYQADYTAHGGVPFDFETATPSPYAIATPPLQRGTDFDVVVLAVAQGGLPALCPELAKANQKFADMLSGMKTIRTQALQVWLKCRPSKLEAPSGLAISYCQPFNSFADMSQVLPHEGWPANQVLGVAYVCDELPDGVVSDAAAPKHVAQNAVDFLNGGGVNALWPTFNPAVDEHRRYTRVNLDGSERYVLSEKGAIQLRLAPGGSGFTNLALAGDWVHTHLDSGCLEAATMGGLGAAEAIDDGTVHP